MDENTTSGFGVTSEVVPGYPIPCRAVALSPLVYVAMLGRGRPLATSEVNLAFESAPVSEVTDIVEGRYTVFRSAIPRSSRLLPSPGGPGIGRRNAAAYLSTCWQKIDLRGTPGGPLSYPPEI